jgi:deoxyadenosine/deoxycytidine kinase
VRTAYLVVFVDVSMTTPSVVGAGIYSEDNVTASFNLAQMVLTSVNGKDYQEAHDRMIETINSLDAWHPWAKLIAAVGALHHGEGRPRFVVNREGEMKALRDRMVELDREMGAPAGHVAPGGGA